MEKTKHYGGNAIWPITLDRFGASQLANGGYFFQLIRLREKTVWSFPGDCSCTVVSLEGRSRFRTGGSDGTLGLKDSLQLENCPTQIEADKEQVLLLASGCSCRNSEKSTYCVTVAGHHYQVSKPWGHELWLNGKHPGYCVKEIFIRKGQRTSLQFHQVKDETILVLQGKAKLVHKKDASVLNEKVTVSELDAVTVEPVSCLHTPPLTLHRWEALEDFRIFEASTPQLDDVVRVQDDAGRSSGRIASEHLSWPLP